MRIYFATIHVITNYCDPMLITISMMVRLIYIYMNNTTTCIWMK